MAIKNIIVTDVERHLRNRTRKSRLQGKFKPQS